MALKESVPESAVEQSFLFSDRRFNLCYRGCVLLLGPLGTHPRFNREPSIRKNDWPSTAEEQIFQEGFNLLWTVLQRSRLQTCQSLEGSEALSPKDCQDESFKICYKKEILMASALFFLSDPLHWKVGSHKSCGSDRKRVHRKTAISSGSFLIMLSFAEPELLSPVNC